MRPALILFALSTSFLYAQNLVPNPGFELYGECPTSIGQISKAIHWYSANTGTPEYAHLKCPFAALNVHSGQGMAGLILHAQYPKAIEYIGTRLTSPLQKDSLYCIGFHVRAEESLFYIDKIGLVLSAQKVQLKQWAPIQLSTAVRSPEGTPIHHMQGWLRVADIYKAAGDENFITIGNFNRPEALTQYMNEFAWGIEPGWNSYYFIDDVFVYPTDAAKGCVEQFSASADISVPGAESIASDIVKDTLRLTVYFDFDSDTLSVVEITRLIDAVEGGDFQTVSLTGHTDGRGSVEYNLQLSQRRVRSVEKILAQHFKKPFPNINSHYFGKLKPVADNALDAGRDKNRRVEIICLPKLKN